MITQTSDKIFDAMADLEAQLPPSLRALAREWLAEELDAIRYGPRDDGAEPIGLRRLANRAYDLHQRGELPDAWVRVILSRTKGPATATLEDFYQGFKESRHELYRKQTKQILATALPPTTRQALTKPVADRRHQIRGGSEVPATAPETLEQLAAASGPFFPSLAEPQDASRRHVPRDVYNNWKQAIWTTSLDASGAFMTNTNVQKIYEALRRPLDAPAPL
jgi:hypothetical protein